MKKASLSDLYFKIIITECICVAIILLSVLVTKYFFKSTYLQLKSLYTDNICNHTNVDEVLKGGDLSEI